MSPIGQLRVLALALSMAAPATGAAAHEQNVFAFGGALTTGNMHQSARPLRVGYETNPILGFGYQRFLPAAGSFSLGAEMGGAARLGGRVTGEVWAGAVLRHEGARLGQDLRLISAMTVGLSHITATHRGRETFLEDRYEGNARTLFYLGPELSLSRASAPDRELFWRLHHRSGGGRTLGNMKGAANANVIGLRLRF